MPHLDRCNNLFAGYCKQPNKFPSLILLSLKPFSNYPTRLSNTKKYQFLNLALKVDADLTSFSFYNT